MKTKKIARTLATLLVAAAVTAASAAGQELTFENLDFDGILNARIEKADLVEKVVLIHLWGST